MEASRKVEVVSIQVGKPKPVPYGNREIMTAFNKQPVRGPVWLAQLNLAGDQQANLEYHGGPDKAVCAYPMDHYAYWEQKLGRPLAPGAFGENLTLRGLLEDELCVGDVFRLGEALLQVTEARIPCVKTAIRHGVDDMPLQLQKTGYTGFYFRVLQEGHVEAGQTLELVERHPLGVKVSYLNQIRYHDRDNVEGLRRILEVNELSGAWRVSLQKRLDKLLAGE
jgi:MOSC domain-containing protein YiiM